MSSGNMPRTQHPQLFQWVSLAVAGGLPAGDHRGRRNTTASPPRWRWRWNSAATTAIRGHVEPAMLEDWTIRKLDAGGWRCRGAVAPYHLQTEVYADEEGGESAWRRTTIPE